MRERGPRKAYIERNSLIVGFDLCRYYAKKKYLMFHAKTFSFPSVGDRQRRIGEYFVVSDFHFRLKL